MTMQMHSIFNGYVEYDGEVVRVEIFVNDNGDYFVWQSEELRDDLESDQDSIRREYGNFFYANLNEYRNGTPVYIWDIFDEGNRSRKG